MSSIFGGLLQLVAKPGKEPVVQELVLACAESLAKSNAIQLCYGLKYVGPAFPNAPVKEGTTSTSSIVVICKSKNDLEKGLQELNGHLKAKGAITDIVVEIPKVKMLDIFASKITAGKPTAGARVLMEARPETAADVKSFLSSIVPKDDANAFQWFTFQVEGSNFFGITGFFADEPSRDTRLSGDATKSMFAKGKEWFVALPDAVKVDVLESGV